MAVWAIPHTIGLRYITTLLLIGLMIWVKPNLAGFLKKQPLLIILTLYFFIHIFFVSNDFPLSIKSFKQEWLKFLIFNLLGASLGIYFSKSNQKDLFLWLGGAFSIPLLIHIFLFLLKSIQENSIPLGYAGLSDSHGDLGYTALQASIFLTIYIFSDRFFSLKKFAGSTLLFFCFLSPYLAQSRGGLIFVFVSVIVVACFFYLKKDCKVNFKRIIAALTLMIIFFIISIKIVSIGLSGKWQNIGGKIETGLIGNPIAIMCNVTEEIYNEINKKNKTITHQI
jgi:Flp pilus assembly pilin Flp